MHAADVVRFVRLDGRDGGRSQLVNPDHALGMTDPQEFSEKMAAFVGTHRRIVEDFGRSLANSRHFIVLADRSSEREPEETVTMLEQIREIDLLGHLSAQFEEYRNIAVIFVPPDAPPEHDTPLLVQVAELQQRYEALMEEAEEQMAAVEKLLFALQNHQ